MYIWPALIAAGVLHASVVDGVVRTSNGRPAVGAVIFLKGSERSRPLAHAMVDQRDRKFIPHVSIVTVGTKVQFPNNDTIFHNVFSEFHSNKIQLGMYARGQSRMHSFDQPGLAVIMCSIHPDMGAYIMVVDTPYYALADKSGRYHINGVPSGHYEVEGWHESGQKFSGQLDIRNGGADVDTMDVNLRK